MHNRLPMTHYRGVRLPTRADVETAARRLAGMRAGNMGRVCRTPMLRSAWLSERTRAVTGGRIEDVWMKVESVQPGGSFKIRGALNALHSLRLEHPDTSTVVTASA